MARLDEKIAIITGAAGGIGAATAEKFLQEGAKVMLVDLDQDKLDETAASLDAGDRVATFAADVSDPEQVAGYVDACVEQFGGVDVLFANAGTEGKFAPLTQVDFEAFDRVQKVNVYGCWLGIKHAAPKIAERGGGSIIITSSVAGIVGSAGLGPYVTSKHAVVGLMKTAAQELAGVNIRVNTINPGPIANRMMESIEQQASPEAPEAVHEGFEQQVPMKRYGRNEEVANMALFLASDESTYSTGSQFVVDGGFTSM
ncbi:SDR family oxidoreductase [Persicimonas caeni]|uniref:SDR family oxidoreductase n=1 Tax=Persicimonas caeni TaxID=2292766 RepID=A0A4Y6PMI6_PERCE|nr:SDR family NAD(P)-dependent oxidoreductase [Persicimonas caeni]QDG49470.1 SDR family oxidoreductase [Persicimonas caeni]QED30691.1 SDR family oxidoreductase [Persicimonas caeni]